MVADPGVGLLARAAAPRAGASALVALALLASCSTAGQRDEEAQEDRVARRLEEQADEAPPQQRSALSDGEVRYGEYSAAVGATVACLERKGVAVDGPHVDPANSQLLVFGYGGTSSTDGLDDLRPVYERCYEEHLSIIDEIYTFSVAAGADGNG